MLPNEEIRRWIADSDARARSRAQATKARLAWARTPSIARLSAELDDSCGDPARVEAIAAALLQAQDLPQTLFVDALRAIDNDPFFTPPFTAASGGVGESVRLFEHPHLTVSLVMVHADGIGAKAARRGTDARSVTFSGVLTLRRIVRAGGGVVQRYAAVPGDDCLTLDTHPAATKGSIEALCDDQLLVVDGRSEAIAFVHARSAILYLECEILAGCAPYSIKYDSRTLLPFAAATTDQRASRCQLMMSALTALGRSADNDTYRLLLKNKSFEVRWHTVRELMAVDPDGAWDCLSHLAANDRHPEIRAAAHQMLAARNGGGTDMPRVIATACADVACLEEIVDALEATPFDARDEEAFAAFAPRLKALANNADFLSDTIKDDLKDYCVEQQTINRYGAQVVMLYSGNSFTIRANIWPDVDHPLVRANGMASFFYGLPHDHNVSFLTVGYAGPGYWSDYYEYDYDQVGGLPGEPVALRAVERSRLDQGKVQLYRAHRDVHSQLPPDELSISLNIMESSPAAVFLDQYVFDASHQAVSSFANPLPHDSLFAVAAALREPEAISLLGRVSARHPSTRIRFSAFRALSAAAPTSDERIAVLERAVADDNHVIRELARSRIAEIESARPWLNKNIGHGGDIICH